MSPVLRNPVFVFVLKFILLFSIFYFGTLAVIGLAAPGRYYSPFIENYFDYVSWIKHSLTWGVKQMAALMGYHTSIRPGSAIYIVNGGGVMIAMDCVGYGVYSFWAAYVIAQNDIAASKKMGWTIGGILLLWLINVVRITLFLIAINRGWKMPFGIDHHTWFNIVAYAAIFFMMFLFEKNKSAKESSISNTE